MTNKPEMYTILLQEEKIKKLTAQNKVLESANADLFRINAKLRAQIRKLQRNENQLNEVNI